MTTASAAKERRITIKKKSGSNPSNWSVNDAAAPGLLDAVLVTNPVNLRRMIDKNFEQSIGNEVPTGDVFNESHRAEFQVQQELRFNDLAGHLPWAMSLGESGGTPEEPNPATGGATRDQYYVPAPNLHGVVATVCEGPTTSHAAAQPSVSVCPSAQFYGFTWTGQGAGPVQSAAQAYGIDVFEVPAPAEDALDDDITLNATRALVSAATVSSTGRRLNMGGLKLHLDVRSGNDDFAATEDHVIRCSRFEFAFQRALDWPSLGSQDANAPDLVARPQMPVNGDSDVVPTLTVELPRWENTTFFGRYTANTRCRAWLEFTGDEIESGFSERMRIELPNIIERDYERSPDGNIRQSLSFNCYDAPSTPIGFSGTEMVRVNVRNQKTANALA